MKKRGADLYKTVILEKISLKITGRVFLMLLLPTIQETDCREFLQPLLTEGSAKSDFQGGDPLGSEFRKTHPAERLVPFSDEGISPTVKMRFTFGDCSVCCIIRFCTMPAQFTPTCNAHLDAGAWGGGDCYEGGTVKAVPAKKVAPAKKTVAAKKVAPVKKATAKKAPVAKKAPAKKAVPVKKSAPAKGKKK